MLAHLKSAIPLHLHRRIGRARWRMFLRKSMSGKPFRVPEGCPERALPCCVAYNRYGAYCVPLSGADRPEAMHVMAGRPWEPYTIELLTQEASGGGDIVHAGTYFGDFLPAVANATTEIVWAFEPNPESYRCALITLALNDIRNVILSHAGLGDRCGVSPFVMHLGGESHFAETGKDGVRIVTIDNALPSDRHVGLIHLDIEGFEQRALAGAMDTIRRCRPVIVVETIQNDKWLNGEWFRKNLAPLRYYVAERMPARAPENAVLRVATEK